MELYHLQTFVMVAEEKSITRAAMRLYTTPSTVSMHIKTLEEEFCVQLFTRTNQGMSITPKGQQLYEKALHTLRAAQDMLNHAANMQETLLGSLTLGLCSDPALLRIPRLLEHLQAHHPGIDVTLEKSASPQILEGIAANQLDLGFAFGSIDHPTLSTQYLTTVELVVVIPAQWQSTFDAGNWVELARQPWVMVGKNCPFHDILDHHLTAQGLVCRHLVQINDERSRCDLVVAGMGLSLLERDTAEQVAAERALCIAPVDPFTCDLSVAYRQHEVNHPIIRCLLTLIQSVFT